MFTNSHLLLKRKKAGNRYEAGLCLPSIEKSVVLEILQILSFFKNKQTKSF